MYFTVICIVMVHSIPVVFDLAQQSCMIFVSAEYSYIIAQVTGVEKTNANYTCSHYTSHFLLSS